MQRVTDVVDGYAEKNEELRFPRGRDGAEAIVTLSDGTAIDGGYWTRLLDNSKQEGLEYPEYYKRDYHVR